MKKPHNGKAESDSRDHANGAKREFPLKSALLGVALILALVFTLYEAWKSVTLIDAFEVPKSLADQGYSPQTVANQIVDEIYNIHSDVRTRASKGQVGLSSEGSLPDIEVPETKVSLKTIGRFIQSFLHLEPRHIGGEIVSLAASGNFHVTFRIVKESDRIAVRNFDSQDGMNEVIRQLARRIVSEIDPYIMATYSYQIDHSETQAFQLIGPCIRDEHCKFRAWAFNFWGNILADQRKFDEAAEKYLKASELDPKMALPHVNLARLLGAQKKDADAIKEFQQAIRLDPKLALAYHNWGAFLEQRKDYAAAAARYQEALRVDPTFAPSYVGLGNVSLAQKDSAGAERNYRTAIDRDPKLALAHIALGNLLASNGSTQQEAIDEYQEAINADRKSPAAYNGLGTIFYNRRQWDQAEELFRRVVELDLQSPVGNTNLGNVLFQQSRFDEALAYLTKAAELDNRYAPAHSGLAALYDELRKSDEAKKQREILAQIGTTP